MKNIKIRNIEVISGDKIINNDYFLKHFKTQGKEINGLLDAFGKKERKIIDKKSNENTLTLGIKVAKKIMKTSGLIGEDIDMIIFTSQFPEYTLPTQALFIHKAIKGKPECLIMDSNINCLGMVAGVDVAVRYLREKSYFKRALVIGSDYATIHCKTTDELTYPMWGDSACAVILEKTDEDYGMIGSSYYTNSDNPDMVLFPKCGYSHIYNEIEADNMKIEWNPFSSEFITTIAKQSVNKVLEYHNLKMKDINAFCFSQFALSLIKAMANEFNVDEEKFIYSGDKYGYTGTSSPFIAFYEGIKAGKIKKGDNIVFWSVGTNYTTCALLFKY